MGKYWQLFLMISKRHHFPFLKMQQNVGLPREWSHCQSLVEKRDMYSIRSDKPKIELATDVGPRIGGDESMIQFDRTIQDCQILV